MRLSATLHIPNVVLLGFTHHAAPVTRVIANALALDRAELFRRTVMLKAEDKASVRKLDEGRESEDRRNISALLSNAVRLTAVIGN